MLKRDVIKFYGGTSQAARAIGISRMAIYQWGEQVPAISALKFSMASAGKLKFDPAKYCSVARKAS